jgi:hypothetical protein
MSGFVLVYCSGIKIHPKKKKKKKRDVLLDAHKLVQQLLMPNLQGHPSLYNIVHHAFFTRSIVPRQIFASAWDMPPDF